MNEADRVESSEFRTHFFLLSSLRFHDFLFYLQVMQGGNPGPGNAEHFSWASAS